MRTDRLIDLIVLFVDGGFKITMSEADLTPSRARWDGLLHEPLLVGPARGDYAGHKVAIEVIFPILFPRWRRELA
jgi:hypothetical protein